VVLFSRSAGECAKETGAVARTVHRRDKRFDQEGLATLFVDGTPPRPEDQRPLPPPLRQLIVDLKAEHAAFRLGQIARIYFVDSCLMAVLGGPMLIHNGGARMNR